MNMKFDHSNQLVDQNIKIIDLKMDRNNQIINLKMNRNNDEMKRSLDSLKELRLEWPDWLELNMEAEYLRCDIL